MSASITIWERGRLDARVGPRQVLFGRMYEDASVELKAFRPGSRRIARPDPPDRKTRCDARW